MRNERILGAQWNSDKKVTFEKFQNIFEKVTKFQIFIEKVKKKVTKFQIFTEKCHHKSDFLH